MDRAMPRIMRCSNLLLKKSAVIDFIISLLWDASGDVRLLVEICEELEKTPQKRASFNHAPKWDMKPSGYGSPLVE
jgi:hypothetical protein